MSDTEQREITCNTMYRREHGENDLESFVCFPESDDDEDIAVHRKPHRNAITDSDSEEEEAAADNSVHMAEPLVLSASSGDEKETREEEEKGKSKGRAVQKGKRISRAPIDSEDSEPEQEKCGEMEEQPEDVRKEKKSLKREKSRRHQEKKEKRSKAVEKLKKKERFPEVSEARTVASV